MFLKLKKPGAIYYIVALVSFALTAITIYNYPVFNIDGFLYLRVADTYLNHGLLEAVKLYNWPFYSILIAGVHTLTSLSLLHSAYCLSFIFFTLLIVIFLKVFSELDASPEMLWIAALVILVWHMLNGFRADLIRGPGYWCSYLLSLWFFLRFNKTQSWRSAIGWSLSASLGVLFRIEGGVFLILAPCIVFFFSERSWRERTLLFVKLNVLLGFYLLVLFFVILYFHLSGEVRISLYLGRIPELISRFIYVFQLFPKDFHLKTQLLRAYVLGPLSFNLAGTFLFFGVVGTYLFEVISAISLPYLIVCFYVLFNRLRVISVEKDCILLGYFIINLFITSFYFLEHIYISNRYLVAAVFPLLCYVPFGLRALYQKWQERRSVFSYSSILFLFVSVLMIMMVVGSLHNFGTSKKYINQSAKWLKAHTSKNARIYTNEAKLMFLANRTVVGWDESRFDYFTFNKMKEHPWKDQDYLVLRIEKNHGDQFHHLLKIMHSQPIKVFENKRKGDKVVIFKILNMANGSQLKRRRP